MSALLQVDGLCAQYGSVRAVDDVSLTVSQGSIVSIVGPNGAGKTTLLNTIMGLHEGTWSGSIRQEGTSVDRLDAEARIKRGICLVPEKRELFASLSVQDNLRLGAFARRKAGTDGIESVFERFPRLRERRKQLAGTLSGGERQMLAIGRALMSDPLVLMLDEPSLGLAPRIVEDMFRIITDLRAAGVSILLVEQNARAALDISDYGYVLELGSVSLHGASKVLATDSRVVETYLGVTSRTEPLS